LRKNGFNAKIQVVLMLLNGLKHGNQGFLGKL